jgi:cyclase
MDLVRSVSDALSIPVIASGGAGKLEHMADVLQNAGADAVLAASIFHFGEYTVGDVKRYLAARGVPVRLNDSVAL